MKWHNRPEVTNFVIPNYTLYGVSKHHFGRSRPRVCPILKILLVLVNQKAKDVNFL